MPFLSVRIIPPAGLIQKRFERLRRQIPLVSRKRMYTAMVAIRHAMKQPGAKPDYPIKWDTARQRKAFFASDGFGRGIPTKRGGEYTKGWQVIRSENGYDVGNPLAHSRYIGGTARSTSRQSRIHRGRWNLFKIVKDKVLARLPKAVKESPAADRAARRISSEVTDYFVTAETGLITLLKTELTSFFPNGDKQVTASDDTVYDNGNDFYATTYPGAFPVTDRASTHLIYEWEILLDLLSKWKTTESRAWNENGFKALRSAVINLINHTEKGRTLGKTNFIKSATISAEDRPRYIPLRTSDPNNPIFSHIGQVCIVTVTMHVPRT